MHKKLQPILSALSGRQILEAEACTGCGECVKLCPVYAIEPEERLTARGKIDLFKNLLRNEKPPLSFLLGNRSNPNFGIFQDALWKCTVCGQCHFVCPARIDTPNLWEALRGMMGVGGYGPPQEQQEYLQIIKTHDNSFNQPQAIRRTWLEQAYAEGQIMEPVRNILEHPAPVLYFMGCTATYDVTIRQVALDTINVLQKAGIDFAVLGENELCCSGKMKRMGEVQFNERARANIEQFNALGIKTLVASCAGCYKTINEDYPKIAPLNFEVLHVSEMVHRLLQQKLIAFQRSLEVTTTYHDPCHLGRNCGVYEAPREVLKAIPGLQLVEMERNRQKAKCCGGGGGLKLVDHDLQIKASAARLEDAEAIGAAMLTTPCPTCYLSLKKGQEFSNSPVELQHFMSIVRKALDLIGPA